MSASTTSASGSQPAYLEIEVKFFVPDLAQFRQQLLAAGGKPVRPRVFERNVRFDTNSNELAQRGQLLRLRQDTAARLTFKRESVEEVVSEAKVREELETGVADFDTMAAILARLGFEPRQVYEKYRETFYYEMVEVVLDEMPFGHFIELEGDEAAIRAAAESLSLDWGARILDNYLTLMARIKERHQLPFDDLTFDNFAGIAISAADLFA